jgi:acetyl-CoA C-acetyltransferase
MVVAPYTQRLIARDQVNQSAALVLTSTALADDLGIPLERRVYLHGQAAAGEQPVTLRPDMGQAPSAGLALNTALERAEVNAADIDLFDFYSCFPIAVSNAIDALGIVADDPRGLTLTGGLPYFGGPGNSYSMHAIAEAVTRLRSGQGQLALVAANGGFLTKYAVGIYGRAPTPYRSESNAELDLQMQAIGTVPFESKPSGQATVESYTVAFSREGSATMSIVAARLEGSNARCLARTGDGDEKTPQQTTSIEPIGRKITIQAGDNFNTFLFAD